MLNGLQELFGLTLDFESVPSHHRALFMPSGAESVLLERSQIAAFREALDEAIAQAEADLRTDRRVRAVT